MLRARFVSRRARDIAVAAVGIQSAPCVMTFVTRLLLRAQPMQRYCLVHGLTCALGRCCGLAGLGVVVCLGTAGKLRLAGEGENLCTFCFASESRTLETVARVLPNRPH